jgi:hypothetical protein
MTRGVMLGMGRFPNKKPPEGGGKVKAAVALLALYAFLYFRNRNGEWHDAGRGKLRRFVNGQWQYREMTEEELDEDWQARQW